ncbi:MAG TPA: hypothetical protein VFO27_12065 [Bryobacteraceae bacterium]|nr:hypothetical protein [Bryobacteraceae bacterium]
MLLTFALGVGVCGADPGPGIAVTCQEAAMSQPSYIGVKNPHSRLKENPNSIWIQTGKYKLAAPKSPEEACELIASLAKELQLSTELKDKTTVVIYGPDIEVAVPPGLKVKIDKF